MPYLKEIRWHGRGGQGAVTASELLAKAAFLEGMYVTAFPFFGAERRGAPVMSFNRISDEPIMVRSQIYEPDVVVVMDPTLLIAVDVAYGLKEGGMLIINTAKKPKEIGVKGPFSIASVDATEVSLELGLLVAGSPVLNTPMLGAFSKATRLVSLGSIVEVIKEEWPGPAGEMNAKAAEVAYDRVEEYHYLRGG